MRLADIAESKSFYLVKATDSINTDHMTTYFQKETNQQNALIVGTNFERTLQQMESVDFIKDVVNRGVEIY